MGNLDDETQKAIAALIAQSVEEGQSGQTLWFKIASVLAAGLIFLGTVMLNDFRVNQIEHGKGIAELKNRVSIIETKVDLRERVKYRK